jgi:hypothetical protein
MTADGVSKCVLVRAAHAKIAVGDFGVHSLRATAAMNTLDHEPDVAKVQEHLGDTNVVTTGLYDRHKHRPEDSPTFKVAYRRRDRLVSIGFHRDTHAIVTAQMQIGDQFYRAPTLDEGQALREVQHALACLHV